MSDQPVRTHLPSVALLIISIIGLATSLFSAIAFLVLMKLAGTVQSLDAQVDQSVYVLVWLGVFLALLAIPSIVLSIRRLARLPISTNQPRSAIIPASIAFLVVIPLLYLISVYPNLLANPFLKVLISVVTVTIPLWWIVELGQNKLPKSSHQRFWGLVNFQMFAGMPLVFFVEIMLVFLAMILGGVWLASKNEFAPILMTLQTQLMVDPNNMNAVMEQFGSLLQDPAVLAAIFFALSIVTPLVEELLKPLALWFFIKREWTEAEGFSAGLVCGAAFALVESVTTVASLPPDNWTALLIARIGTGLLHTLTTGLTGWALVSAWKNGNYKRLGVTYLISMSLHGVWNFFALLTGLGTNLEFFSNLSLNALSGYAPWVLGSLSAGMLAALHYMNRKVLFAQVPPLIPPEPPEIIR